MKALHWGKIVLKPGGKPMVWDGLRNEIEFDQELLEEMFAVKKNVKMAKKGPGGKEGADGETKPEATILRVLAPKRSNAIGIMSSRMPPVDAIVSAIRTMDASVLSMEDITALLNNFPSDEEILSIREAATAEGKLDTPEVFCMKITSVPNMKDRLKAWKFLLSFDEFVEEIQIPLFGIEEACKELRKSKKLKQIMVFFLELGNYINGGSARGQADGFEISSLPKLADTKDVTNTITLLEHGINQMKKRNPDLLTFAEELSRIPKASQISFTNTAENLRKLILEMKDVRADILRMKEQAETEGRMVGDDPFIREMPKFADKATQKVLQVRDLLADVEALFHDTLEYFHVNVKGDALMTTEEFFGIFNQFIEQFKKIASKRPPAKKTGVNTKGKKVGGDSNAEDPMANIINAIVAGKTENAKDALTPKVDGPNMLNPKKPMVNSQKPAGGELANFKFRPRTAESSDENAPSNSGGGGGGGGESNRGNAPPGNELSQVKLRSAASFADQPPPNSAKPRPKSQAFNSMDLQSEKFVSPPSASAHPPPVTPSSSFKVQLKKSEASSSASPFAAPPPELSPHQTVTRRATFNANSGNMSRRASATPPAPPPPQLQKSNSSIPPPYKSGDGDEDSADSGFTISFS
jgi:hypothetical protein